MGYLRFGCLRFAIPIVLSGLIVIPVFGPEAQAEEKRAEEKKEEEKKPTLEERLEGLEKRVKEQLKEKDYVALDGAISDAKALHYDAVKEEDEDVREGVIDVFDDMVARRHRTVTAPYVLDALGTLGDMDGAKIIKRFLRQRNDEKVTPTLEKAVKAAARVPHPRLVRPLLKIVEDSKVYGIAAEAMLALGHFGTCKRHREKILDDLVKTVKKNKPGRIGLRGGGSTMDPTGQTGGGQTSGQESGPGARWAALSPVLPRALNKLTGKEMRSPGAWFDAVQSARNLGEFFDDES